MRKRKTVTVFAGLILAVVMAFAGIAGGMTAAASEVSDTASEESGSAVHKYINVVYDDSGSMIKEDGDNAEFYDKWCQAKYAMEVFSTMLSEGDTMNVYAMSDGGDVSLTISGDDDAQTRADTIHDWESYSDETPFSVVKAAYSDLKKQGDDVETWLFVITDGAFDDGDTSTTAVKKAFGNYTSKGVKVIYLGIGSDAAEYESDTDAGLYCYHASDTSDGETSEILDCMTEISNLISERLELTSDYITESDGTITLDIDVPMEEIIVFAQGDSVSIGDMSNSDSEVKAESSIEVTYCEEPTAALGKKYGSKIAVADYLSGVVKTFVSAEDDGVLSSGKYSFTISGVSDLSDVKIYYKANVKAALTITQDGETIDPSEDYIQPGEVTIQAALKDPSTGVTVDSELMDDIDVTYTITNGGETYTLSTEEGTVSEDGTATFTAAGGELLVDVTIEMPGDYTVSESYTYQVMELLSELTIDEVTLENMDGGGNFKKEELIEENGYALITVKQDGELLSEEYWLATEVEIEAPEDSCLSLSVTRGEDVSTYIVEVVYDYDGDKNKLEDEIADCTVTARLELDGKAATSDGAAATVTAEKLTLLYLLKRYMKQLIALAIILIIVIGYLPGVKKRLPKAKTPVGRAVPINGMKAGEDYKGSFNKNFLSVILPYVREKGTITYAPRAAGFSRMYVRAVNKRQMEITNAANHAAGQAGKMIKFNGKEIDAGTRKYKISTRATIEASDGKIKYTCTLGRR